jgi:NAD(P)-dependent dehydrogenase (short-subunit alcohol dehydrogenase family)
LVSSAWRSLVFIGAGRSGAIMDRGRHTGRTAVVTGAASGIGRATVVRLVGEGARVIGADVDAEGLASLLTELGGAESAFTPVTADVTREEDVAGVLAAARGPADLLVNNAGVMDYFLPITQLDDATWERVMAINVTAVMRMTRAFLPGMVEAGRGAVVMVASVGGLGGGAAGTAYTTSKHAVIGLTRSVAYLYGLQGIRTNAVCPGGVETNIGTTATPQVPWVWDRLQGSMAGAVRMAAPDEIAALISWLGSDEASNVNGAVIAADAGWTAA